MLSVWFWRFFVLKGSSRRCVCRQRRVLPLPTACHPRVPAARRVAAAADPQVRHRSSPDGPRCPSRMRSVGARSSQLRWCCGLVSGRRGGRILRRCEAQTSAPAHRDRRAGSRDRPRGHGRAASSDCAGRSPTRARRASSTSSSAARPHRLPLLHDGDGADRCTLVSVELKTYDKTSARRPPRARARGRTGSAQRRTGSTTPSWATSSCSRTPSPSRFLDPSRVARAWPGCSRSRHSSTSAGVEAAANYDEGVYLASLDALRHGQELGTDVYASQPPGFYVLLQGLSLLPGDGVEGSGSPSCSWRSLGLVAAYAIGRKLAGVWGAFGAAAPACDHGALARTGRARPGGHGVGRTRARRIRGRVLRTPLLLGAGRRRARSPELPISVKLLAFPVVAPLAVLLVARRSWRRGRCGARRRRSPSGRCSFSPTRARSASSGSRSSRTTVTPADLGPPSGTTSSACSCIHSMANGSRVSRPDSGWWLRSCCSAASSCSRSGLDRRPPLVFLACPAAAARPPLRAAHRHAGGARGCRARRVRRLRASRYRRLAVAGVAAILRSRSAFAQEERRLWRPGRRPARRHLGGRSATPPDAAGRARGHRPPHRRRTSPTAACRDSSSTRRSFALAPGR